MDLFSILAIRLRGAAKDLPRTMVSKYVVDIFSSEPHQPIAFWKRVQGCLAAIGVKGKLGDILTKMRFSALGNLLKAPLEASLACPLVLASLGLKIPFPSPIVHLNRHISLDLEEVKKQPEPFNFTNGGWVALTELTPVLVEMMMSSCQFVALGPDLDAANSWFELRRLCQGDDLAMETINLNEWHAYSWRDIKLPGGAVLIVPKFGTFHLFDDGGAFRGITPQYQFGRTRDRVPDVKRQRSYSDPGKYASLLSRIR